MPIDQAVIGSELEPTCLTVEAGRLRFFAKAIGETNPIFFDDHAASAAGHRALPVPPTFLFAIELERPDPFDWIVRLGVDVRSILHGEQEFVYHSVAYVGDILTARPKIIDVFTKKNGALEFVVKETTVGRSDGCRIADLKTVLVVRNVGVGE